MGSQAGVVDINHAFHLYYNCCIMWIEFQSISTWLWGFSPGTPVSSKLTPSLIHLAVVLCSEVIYYGSCSGAEHLTGSTAPSVRPHWAAPFTIQSTDCEKGWLAGLLFIIDYSQLRRVSNMTPGGRKKTLRSMVVVGNKNGVAGKVLWCQW